MKKLVYLLILAVMLPAALHAQVLVNESNDALIKSKNPSSIKFSTEALESTNATPVIKNRDSKIQATDWIPAGPVVGASIYNGGLSTNRVVYDPFSGILIFPNYANIRNNPEFNDGGPYGEVRLTFTDDATSSSPTFQTTPIFGLDDNYMLNPSLTVLNTRNASDISGLDMFIVPWTAALRPPDTNQFYFNGVAYGIYDAENGSTISDIGTIHGPFVDQDGNDIFQKLRYTPDYYTTGYNYDGEIVYYHVSRTTAEEAFQSEFPGGAYSFAYLTGDASDFNSYISPKWSPDNFANFGGGNISAAMLTDVDPAGNVYIMTNNVHGDVTILEQDPEWVWRRLPGFFKSTDRGVTWSDVDTVPRAKIEAWITSKGGDPSPNNRMFDTQISYGQAGFIVLGEDHLIYATPIYVWYPDGTYDQFLISVEYNNGEWDVEEIDQLNFVENIYYFSDVIPDEDRGTNLTLPVTISDRDIPVSSTDTLYNMDAFTQKSRLWEIELALTNDGNVICKWNGYRDENAPISSPILLFGDDSYTAEGGVEVPHGFFPETGVYTTDIYTTYKEVGADGWTEPNNITNDAAFNKFSMMPNRVPSLKNVPIFELQTGEFYTTDRGTARAQAGYPDFFLNWFSDHSRQNVMYANFNIADPNSVETATESNLEVLNPYPNPATNLAELAVNLEAPALVTITVYDAMGKKVADVHSDYVAAGFKSFTLNTEKYATGAYYVNYTIDGVKAATKMLNVVK